MLIIQKLTLDQISLFKQYAYPNFRSKLQEAVESPKHAVLRATMFNQPAGLLIANRYDQESVCVVESIFVAARFRNMGVATRLFQALIENSKAYAQIHIDYFANLPEMSYLEKALYKAGFDHPQMQSMYFKTDLAALALAPWIRRCKLSPELQMLPWKHMTEQQRKDLEEKRYYDYPQGLSPFIQEEVIQASASIVLQRNDGVIMGWIIYHRHVEHAVLCRSLFITESLQDRGLGLSMIGLSVYRMLEANIPSLVFQVDPNNRRMLRVVEKMIMPYQTEQTEFRQARFIRK
jgi:GNAT superfamily N-acetyltransferase